MSADANDELELKRYELDVRKMEVIAAVIAKAHTLTDGLSQGQIAARMDAWIDRALLVTDEIVTDPAIARMIVRPALGMQMASETGRAKSSAGSRSKPTIVEHPWNKE